MNFNRFAHATLFKSLSLSRGGAVMQANQEVQARRVGDISAGIAADSDMRAGHTPKHISLDSSVRTNPGAAKPFSRGLATLIVGAASVVGISNSEAKGAVVFANQQQASIDLGRRMAELDMVRQLEINVPEFGIQHGSASPEGGKFSGTSFHYIEAILNAGYSFTSDDIPANNPNKQFNINIAVGPSRSERTFFTRVASYEKAPSLDYMLLEHKIGKYSTIIPEYEASTNNSPYTFGGFGNDVVFYNNIVTNNQTAGSWMMARYDSNGTEVDFTSDGSGITSLVIPGSGFGGDSGSSSYHGNLLNPTGLEKKVSLTDRAANDIMGGFGLTTGIEYVSSGLGQFVTDRTYNTNLQYVNQVPEPYSLSTLLVLSGVLLSRRRQF